MKRIVFAVILASALTAFAIQATGQTAIKGAGVIESTTGGFKFPDGSVQTTAAVSDCIAIEYIPYEVIEAGVYCFTDNLTTSMITGNAITVSADNVVIDLNGWMLDGSNAHVSTIANGIYASQQKSIVIRNGTIAGFMRGVYLKGFSPYTTSRGHVIEHMRIERATTLALELSSSNSIVRNNQVVDIGGSTVNSQGYGIVIWGPDNRILDNDISNVRATSSPAMGLALLGECDDCVIEDNRIDDVRSESNSTYAVRIGSSDSVLAVNNRVGSADYGIYFLSSTGKYKNNLTSNVGTPFTGGTDLGGNN